MKYTADGVVREEQEEFLRADSSISIDHQTSYKIKSQISMAGDEGAKAKDEAVKE